MADPARQRRLARGHDARDGQSPVGEGPALSGGLQPRPHHLRPVGQAARGLAVRRRPWTTTGREGDVVDLRPHLAGASGRQPDVRRANTIAASTSIPGGRSPVHLNLVGDTAAIAGRLRRADRTVPHAGRSGRPPVRRPPFRPLRIPAGPDLEDGRHRPGASPLVREHRQPGLLHRRLQPDFGARALLPHEFTHSWNGKFRRPSDEYVPNLNVPTQNSLMWVYEGQTEYWGEVLAARSGLVTQGRGRSPTSPRSPASTTTSRAANGARCRTRPTTTCSATAPPIPGRRGCAAPATTTARPC